jgi:hypothetical protein
MNISVFFTHLFELKFKRYKKKFGSIEADLKHFIGSLSQTSGTDLGNGIYKYRLSVKSKNKGKRGFRVISFEVLVSEYDKNITLLTIYDKGEQSSISKKEINSILKEEGLI